MPPLETILSFSILGNDVQTYLESLAGLIVVYVIFLIFFRYFLKKLHHFAKRSASDIDDTILHVLHSNQWLIFITVIVIYITLTIQLSDSLKSTSDQFISFLLILLAIRATSHWIDFASQKFAAKKAQAQERFTIELLGKIFKILVWVFGILFMISTFGYDITSLITGLGIGGIAVALALQNILGDLISSISIYLDKPFQVGDLIVFGDKMGTVTNIGLKTTRIMSIHGEEIVISNKRLTESDIQNYGRMRSRRVEVHLSVTYATPVVKMKKIPAGLEKIVKSVKETTFEHAHFKSFDRTGKNFDMVFYVNSRDHQTYLDRLQEVNFKIEEFFAKNKIQFAYVK
jgi:small-conductance mechanosensitive channel